MPGRTTNELTAYSQPPLRATRGPASVAWLLMAFMLGPGCGGVEEDWRTDDGYVGEDSERTTQSSRRCWPAGKKRWIRWYSMRMFSRPTASKKFSSVRRRVPRGAVVRLTDRNGDGKVCRKKYRSGQPNWFIFVRYKGKRGWMRLDGLRKKAPHQNPVPGYWMTTPFGKPGSWAAGYHTGEDYAAPTGAKVVATRPGVVKEVSWGGRYGSAYGLHVVVQTGGIQHLYAHLSRTVVKVGQHVQQGTRLGKVGDTGRSYGSHLHYEERVSPFGYWNHRKPRFNRH